ncbi:hypothetical protein GCM10018965_007430 [Nonomuraea roseola]
MVLSGVRPAAVGLVPGVTNLLVRHCVERSGTGQARVGVLLGSGERHGPSAIRWAACCAARGRARRAG